MAGTKKGTMTVQEAGKKGGRRVRELIEEGKKVEQTRQTTRK